MKYIYSIFFIFFFTSIAIAQSYNDGPIELQVKLREVQGNFSPTDESLLGIGFAPDELSFKIWARDNLNIFPWTGGSCLQDNNFNPSPGGSNSIDFNNIFASFNFPTSNVPQYIDLKVDAWEDDLPSDQLIGFCNTGTACTWNDMECCGVFLFGLCVGIETGDDYRCDANPFYQGMNYRSGSPCSWYSHGYVNGSGCINPSSQSGQPNSTDGYYKPHVETYWRYTKGTSFANAIDLGVLSSGVINHFNSNECYSNYYLQSNGNDVIYSFTVNNPSGVNISLCGVNGAQFDSYLYLLNDTNMIPIASDDNNCGTQSEISTSLCNSGTYYIVVDAVNSNDIGTFTLSLTEDANFSFSSEINIQNVTCASGNDGQINVNILGNGGQPPFDYYWYDINMNTLDSSLFSYSLLDSLTFLDTGIYILEIKDDRDCILRDTINLTSFASLELDITPNNPSICQGTSIDLTVNGGATYFWYPSSSLSSSTGSIVQATPQTTTTYFVVAQGINGCQDTVHVNVGVIPSPNLSTFPNNVSICQGDTVSVIISGGSNYNWSPNVSIDNINNDTVRIFPVNSTTYSVLGVNLSGCSTVLQLPVTVNSNPSVSISSSQNPICIGDITLLSATGANAYSWFPSSTLTFNSGSSVSALPTSSSTYSVVGTDVNNCSAVASINIDVNPLPIISVSPSFSSICEGSNVSLSASGTANFIWSPALGLNNTIGSNVLASPSNTTIYTVTGTDSNGCSQVISSEVNILPKPNIILSPPNADICSGTTVNISAFGADSYLWYPSFGLDNGNSQSVVANPQISTLYTVTGTDLNGCTNSTNFQLNVGIDPEVTINPTNPIICNGESISLSASGASQYTWFPNVNISSVNGSMVSVDPNDNILYTVVGTDDFGCSDTTTTSVSVNDLPTASILNTDKITICSEDTAVILVDVTGTPPWNLEYTVNGSYQSPLNSSFNPITILADIDGEYMISSINDANGCSNLGTGVVSVEVLNTPIANFDFYPQPVSIADPEVTFINNSFFAQSWTWYFGDGFFNSSEFNPTHTYSESGDYFVYLIVNNGQCVDTAKIQLFVDPLFTFYVPDAFTPNNDGLNDIFLPNGKSINKFEMTIYSRWGEKIYFTDDIEKGWDGIKNGRKMQIGEYSYFINIVDDLGKYHTFKGNVILN